MTRVDSGVPGTRPPAGLWPILAVLGLAMLLPGCGQGLARVEGKISVAGKVISGGENVRGTVCFHPSDGVSAPAVGLVNAEGRYEMMTGTSRGVPPGSYQVTISVTEIIPSASPGEAPHGRRLSAIRYTDPKQSGLTAEVKSGRNQFDFSVEP